MIIIVFLNAFNAYNLISVHVKHFDTFDIKRVNIAVQRITQMY